MPDESKLRLSGAIEKFDTNADGTLLVSGIASSEDVDSQGEIITADAMREALPHYLQKGSVREMHQPSAVGVPVSAHVDDDGKTHFTAHIIDKDAIEKVKAGVYKGFSIAGKSLARVGQTVTKLILKTIDLVDIPSNPTAYFTVIKFDKPGDACNDPQCKNHTESAVEKCSICKSKLAKAELNQPMTTAELEKIANLEATVEKLAATIETLSKVAPPDLTKFETAIGDLQKRADEAKAGVIAAERGAILSKMDTEGRVAFNPETGVAFTADELNKMDLPLLKFAAKNSPVIPTQARAIYKGESKPKIDPALKGSALMEKAWEADYGDLNTMRQRFN